MRRSAANLADRIGEFAFAKFSSRSQRKRFDMVKRVRNRKRNRFQFDREWLEPLYIVLLTVFGIASLFRGCSARSAEVSGIAAEERIEASVSPGEAAGTAVLYTDGQNTDTPRPNPDASSEDDEEDDEDEPLLNGAVADMPWEELVDESSSEKNKADGGTSSGSSSVGNKADGGTSSGSSSVESRSTGNSAAESVPAEKSSGKKKSKKSKKDVRKNIFDPAKFGYVSDTSPNITYFDDDFEALQGIDVSEHQGVIDWQAVADAGYKFVFVRVGFRGYGEEGTLNEDSLAINYMKGAEKAGLQVGAYFFSQAISEAEAVEEAEFAAEIIKRSGVTLDLPLVYDPEIVQGVEGRANKITRRQVSANMNAFAEAAQKAINCKVALYANLYWEQYLFDADTLDKYEIWYADYQSVPESPYHFTWWQYSEHGTVPGIKGDMDLNLWIRRMD